MPILDNDQWNLPEDLKRLTREQLNELCSEIRKKIVATTAKNGGHVGSSLGVVELTVALHRVFDSPKDKIVFDVGHQCYPHKLLTGRSSVFSGLRTYEGISGFCRRHESKHDPFGAGHAGTALSASMGIAEGMGRRGDHHKVVAIVGDGGMTCGMVFEAMNQMLPFKKNLVLILNDNKMSIAPNVGAISDFMSLRMTSPYVSRLKDDIKYALTRIPNIGEEIVGMLARIKHSVKHLILPTIMFEGFGFRYIGPIDGHNLDSLEATLQNIKMLEEPVLLHVVTEKGKGYEPAEREKELFHGLGPFNAETGKIVKSSSTFPSYTEIFSKTLIHLAEQDSKIVAITAAMPSGTGLKAFQKQFPDRFYDVGIAEEHAVTFAGGLATEGLKPVVAIYSSFLQRSFDQILHDICLQNLNVTFALDRAGIVGEDGATHHGVFDLSFMRTIPNAICMAPRDELEFQQMLATAVQYEGPASVRYPRGNGSGLALFDGEIPKLTIGQSELVYYPALAVGLEKRWRMDRPEREQLSMPLEGGEAHDYLDRIIKPFNLAIWAVGTGVQASVEAARELEVTRGFRVLVINARFVKPIDRTLLEMVVNKSDALMTVEENVLAGGFGAAILETLEELEIYNVPVRRLGIADEFVPHGAQHLLRHDLMLDPEGIRNKAVAFLEGVQRVAHRFGYA